MEVVKRDIEIFARLVHFGNQHEASRDLALSLKEISEHISQLESKVGAQLFIRDQETAVLTQAGQDLYQQITAQYEANDETGS